jgi:broad specificity phosphatase PhoE
VSDLHCPATLLVARHGDAAYGRPSVLSDEGGWLTELGRAQAAGLGSALLPRRVARVYTSVMQRAVESGAVAAAVIGTDVVELDGLQEYSVGALAGRPPADPELASVYRAWVHGDVRRRIPGGESGEQVLERFRHALQHVADLHRGETVLVFTHGGVMSFALPRLSTAWRQDLADRVFLPNCAPAEVEVDGGGFRLLSWPGSADRAVV